MCKQNTNKRPFHTVHRYGGRSSSAGKANDVCSRVYVRPALALLRLETKAIARANALICINRPLILMHVRAGRNASIKQTRTNERINTPPHLSIYPAHSDCLCSMGSAKRDWVNCCEPARLSEADAEPTKRKTIEQRFRYDMYTIH